MSTLPLELEQELQAMEPDAAVHFERAVREMLLLVRRQNAMPKPAATPHGYEIKARPLGLRPGLSYDNVGALLSQAEGEDWK